MKQIMKMGIRFIMLAFIFCALNCPQVQGNTVNQQSNDSAVQGNVINHQSNDSAVQEYTANQQGSMKEPDLSHFLVSVEDEPDTVDFQCTTIHYTIAQNVFNRLVEMESDENGDIEILPSLAKSWEISDDGRTYTFRLRDDVNFSNGSPLTASDVEYTFTRLLTHPDSCNRDIVDGILGAEALMNGETDQLEGFQVHGDHDFSITLEQPFEAFLACLSMPGASILDKETTEEAGSRFGTDPDWTIGTGSFILRKWNPGEGFLARCDGPG